MEFGVFDHMDHAGVPLVEQYEDRLRLARAYERIGIARLHIAEHHSTPLGMAPSPGIFLSAVAQRTRRLRFGPTVYPIKLYHPLRLAEEICMLDHLSGGRFEFGVGKGASPIELSFYGIDPANAEAQYAEALTVLRQALTEDRVDFEGQFYRFRNIPVELAPLQRPHPPMWYGVSAPDGARRAARNRYNIVTNLPAPKARDIIEAYRDEWGVQGNRPATLPRLGMNRFVVIAETEREALQIADRAFARWVYSFWKLWDERGTRPPVPMPSSFEGVREAGLGVAGTPEMVLDALAEQVEQAGTRYLLCQFAFGDLAFDEAARSVALFGEHVMSPLRRRLLAAEEAKRSSDSATAEGRKQALESPNCYVRQSGEDGN